MLYTHMYHWHLVSFILLVCGTRRMCYLDYEKYYKCFVVSPLMMMVNCL